MCPEECNDEEGDKLFWGKPDPLFTMNERSFPDLPDIITVQTMSRSFDHWNDIDCDGEPIGLDIRAASGTTPYEVGPKDEEPNTPNTIVYYDGDTWNDPDAHEDGALPDSAYALTAIWYNMKNGEILGADMHFNGGMGHFINCPETGCAPGDVDLENVATHEAGHFIGLAHSDVPGSTMLCSAEPDEVEKRSLAQDDIDGACAIYEDGFSSPTSDDGDEKGCSIGHGTQASGLSGLFFAMAALGMRRRRRR